MVDQRSIRMAVPAAFLLAFAGLGSALPSGQPALESPAEVAAAHAEQERQWAHSIATGATVAGLVDSLAADAGLPTTPAVAIAPSPDLNSALQRLALATGKSTPTPAAVATIPSAWQPSLRDLADGLATAAELRNLAISKLAPAEVAALSAWATSTNKTSDANPMPASAAKIDIGLIIAGAHSLGLALDVTLPKLGSLPSLCSGLVPCPVPPPGTCAGLNLPSFYLPPLLALGSSADEGYADDVVLSVDTGGNDAYCNNAASTLPSMGMPCVGLFSPVALVVDTHGNDAYRSSWSPMVPYFGVGTDPSAGVVECFGGVGALGIGVLVDQQGDDRYSSWKSLQMPGGGCSSPSTAAPGPAIPGLTVALGQGAAVAGVGLLLDDDGSDHYLSHIHVCTTGASAAWLEGFQGAAWLGIGALRDRGRGDDAYASVNLVQDVGKTSSAAATSMYTMAGQAFSVGGASALLDEGGSDLYLSQNQVLDLDATTTVGARFTANFVQSFTQARTTLFDGGGANLLLAKNYLESYDMATGTPVGHVRFLHQLDQAVSEVGGVARLIIQDSTYDALLSGNAAFGQSATWDMEPVQAVAGGGGALLHVRDSQTRYLSDNSLAADLSATMTVAGAQALVGGDGYAFLVDGTRSSGGDAYNSFNVLQSGGTNAFGVRFVQGVSPMTTKGRAVFLDEDQAPSLGPQDVFNSHNQMRDLSGRPAGSLSVLFGQGSLVSVVNPPPMHEQIGYAYFENRGGRDDYNMGNVGSVATCLSPNPVTYECIDYMQGEAFTMDPVMFGFATPWWVGTPALIVGPTIEWPHHANFIDVHTFQVPGADNYQAFTSTGLWGGPAGGDGYGMLATNNFGNGYCEDSGDGTDVPAGHACAFDT